MKQLLFILLLITAFPAWSRGISDEGAAREYCDTATIDRIEGIWEFPEDRTRVLIRKHPAQPYNYDIIVVDTEDARLKPGDVIGNVTTSAEPGTYSMSICRRKSDGIFTDPGHCVASLKDNGASLTFKPRKLSIKLGSLWFLPRFWRTVRFRLTDPEADIPKGMVRVYPEPFGSKSKEPVYL